MVLAIKPPKYLRSHGARDGGDGGTLRFLEPSGTHGGGGGEGEAAAGGVGLSPFPSLYRGEPD